MAAPDLPPLGLFWMMRGSVVGTLIVTQTVSRKRRPFTQVEIFLHSAGSPDKAEERFAALAAIARKINCEVALDHQAQSHLSAFAAQISAGAISDPANHAKNVFRSTLWNLTPDSQIGAKITEEYGRSELRITFRNVTIAINFLCSCRLELRGSSCSIDDLVFELDTVCWSTEKTNKALSLSDALDLAEQEVRESNGWGASTSTGDCYD